VIQALSPAIATLLKMVIAASNMNAVSISEQEWAT
jgi:hypothetical protein